MKIIRIMFAVISALIGLLILMADFEPNKLSLVSTYLLAAFLAIEVKK